jgi:hypothetical protein
MTSPAKEIGRKLPFRSRALGGPRQAFMEIALRQQTTYSGRWGSVSSKPISPPLVKIRQHKRSLEADVRAGKFGRPERLAR